VTATATATAGSTFAGWSGGGCSGTGTCTVALNADTSVPASFDANPLPPTHVLTVSVAGSGTVTGPGINCPGDCTEAYADQTNVSLTATPAAGFSFAGWSRACAGGGACNLQMSADRSLTATFAQNPPPLPGPPNTKITNSRINQKNRSAKFSFRGLGG